MKTSGILGFLCILLFSLGQAMAQPKELTEFFGKWRYKNIRGEIKTIQISAVEIQLTSLSKTKAESYQCRAKYKAAKEPSMKGNVIELQSYYIAKSGWPAQSMPFLSFDIRQTLPVKFSFRKKNAGLLVCMKGTHLGGLKETKCALFSKPQATGAF